MQPDPLAPCAAWISHPLSVAGLVVLVLNDHVLKAAWPGVVTGKLSDAAGMLMFPPLLAVLVAVALPRARARVLAVVALVATGAVFGVVKASGRAAEVASHAWSVVNGPSTVLADPTDLLALPVLALSWLAWRRASGRPVTDGRARLVRALVLVPIGLIATVATTARPDPITVIWVGEAEGKPAMGYTGGTLIGVHVGASDDGGRTFETAPPGRPPREVMRNTQACAGSRCYRVVPGELHVQESHDAGRSWTTAWQISGWQYRALAVDHEDVSDPATELSSQSVAVLGTESDHMVLVANGRDGVLRRDSSGNWERVGVKGHSLPPLRVVPDFTGHRVMVGVLGLLAVACAGLVVLAYLAWRSLPRARVRAFLFLAPVTVVLDMCWLFPQRAPVGLWWIWGVANGVALFACATVAVSLYRLGKVRALVALAVLGGATAWIAQARFSLEPTPRMEVYPLRVGEDVIEAVQVAGSLVPVALGLAVAAVAAFALGRQRRAEGP